jgi:uncharacterized membrane protein affecting hemolysin expression
MDGVNGVNLFIGRARNARNKEIVIGHQKRHNFSPEELGQVLPPVRQCAAASSPAMQPSHDTFQDESPRHCMISPLTICFNRKIVRKENIMTSDKHTNISMLYVHISHIIFIIHLSFLFSACFPLLLS